MIVLFNGPPKSGKDHAADYFKNKGWKHLSFKYQLYKETCLYFNIHYTWFMERYDNRALKEVPHIDLGHMSCREAMIHVSETVIKPRRGLDYFGKQVADEIDLSKNYAISDGGFVDELIPVINKVGSDKFVLVQLTREGCDYSTDSRRYFDGNITSHHIIGHTTKINNKYILPHKFEVNTHRIHNNGSVEDFERVLEEIYRKEFDERSEERPLGKAESEKAKAAYIL